MNFIEAISSSFSARCVETLIAVSCDSRDLVKVDQVVLDDRFAEQQRGDTKVSLTGKRLAAAINALGSPSVSPAVLHRDLAGALPPNHCDPIELDRSNWFKNKPVIAIVECDGAGSFDQAKILMCERLDGAPWRNILV